MMKPQARMKAASRMISAGQALVPVYAIRNDTVYEPLAIERP